MRRFTDLLKCLFWLGFVAGCSSLCFSQGKVLTADQASPADWREFSSPEGGFSVEFPGTPTVKVSEVSASSGKVPTHSFMVLSRLYEIGLFVPANVAFDGGRVSLREQDRTESFNSIANRFFDSFDIPAATATMGEVELKLRELRKQHQGPGVLTMAGSGPRPEEPITRSVINGRAIRLVQPAYPATARAAHASGTVEVMVIIDLEGNVAAAETLEGHPLLRPAAIKAARESKFTPTQLEGKPVLVLGVIIYNFVAP